MDLGLQGRRALVLGASRGLGRGIASRLAQEGCDLCIAARNYEKLQLEGAGFSKKYGNKVEAYHLDLCDETSVERFISQMKSISVDILVNNCGGPPPTPILGVDLHIWQQYFESMVLSIIRLTDALVPQMRFRGWGRVLSIVSTGVVQPISSLIVSNSLRSALVAWSKTLATEVARDGVTVNTLAPGRISTERINELDEAAAIRQKLDFDEVRKNNENNLPIGRYGEVEEFAAVAAFLVSQNASYLTGQLICVDGGLVAGI